MSEQQQCQELQLRVKEQRAEIQYIRTAYRSCHANCLALSAQFDQAYARLKELELRLAREEGRWLQLQEGERRRTPVRVREKAVEELLKALGREELLALMLKLQEEVGDDSTGKVRAG